jgi:hypothetical protein
VGVPGLFGIARPAGTDGPRRRWLAGRGPRGISTSALRERLCAHTNSFAEESGHWQDVTIAYGPRGDRVRACSTNAASSCVLRSDPPGARCRRTTESSTPFAPGWIREPALACGCGNGAPRLGCATETSGAADRRNDTGPPPNRLTSTRRRRPWRPARPAQTSRRRRHWHQR